MHYLTLLATDRKPEAMSYYNPRAGEWREVITTQRCRFSSFICPSCPAAPQMRDDRGEHHKAWFSQRTSLLHQTQCPHNGDVFTPTLPQHSVVVMPTILINVVARLVDDPAPIRVLSMPRKSQRLACQRPSIAITSSGNRVVKDEKAKYERRRRRRWGIINKARQYSTLFGEDVYLLIKDDHKAQYFTTAEGWISSPQQMVSDPTR